MASVGCLQWTPVLGLGPVGEGLPPQLGIMPMQRCDVDMGADPFKPREEWVGRGGSGVGDCNRAAEKAGNDLGALLGGELIGSNLDALAKHRVAGLHHMSSEGKHVLDWDLLERLEAGRRRGQSAGG